jgi:regulation of enolase protein 1 (concanavalin A-like superfamily)
MTKQKKEKVVETVVVTLEQYHSPDFHHPSKWMFRNANGDFVFIKVSKREAAEKYIKDNYDGMYGLRCV